MHLSVCLPKVDPQAIDPPKSCPYLDRKRRKQKCSGTKFKPHQLNCHKPLRDTRHSHVQVQRYPVKLDERSLSKMSAHFSCIPERRLVSPAVRHTQGAQRLAVHFGFELSRRRRPVGSTDTPRLQKYRLQQRASRRRTSDTTAPEVA